MATFPPRLLTRLGTDPARRYQQGLILVGEQSLGLFEQSACPTSEPDERRSAPIGGHLPFDQFDDLFGSSGPGNLVGASGVLADRGLAPHQPREYHTYRSSSQTWPRPRMGRNLRQLRHEPTRWAMSCWQDTLPDYVTASRRAQGLPDRVEEPAALTKVATLLRTQQRSLPQGRRRGRPGVSSPVVGGATKGGE